MSWAKKGGLADTERLIHNVQRSIKSIPVTVLLDPALIGDTGHHRRLNSGYAELIGRNRVLVASHRRFKGDGFAPDRVQKVFGTSFYDAQELRRLGRIGARVQRLIYGDRFIRSATVRRYLQALARHRRRGGLTIEPAPGHSDNPSLYADEIIELIETLDLTSKDHLVFTSFDTEMAQSVFELLDRYLPEQLPSLHLRLMYTDDTRGSGPLDYVTVVERLAALECLGQRLWVYCETRAHQQELCRRLNHAVELAPYPALAQPQQRALTSQSGAQPAALTISYLGEARSEKGFALLYDTIQAFSQKHPELAANIRWRIHAGGESPEAVRLRDIERAKPRIWGADIQYRWGRVSDRQYQNMLASADIILAPQDPNVYRLRGSGVAQEAKASGTPLICLAGSSLAEAGPENGVLAAQTATDLVDAIAEMARHYPLWAKRAEQAAPRFQHQLRLSALVRRCQGLPAPSTDTRAGSGHKKAVKPSPYGV